MKIFKIILAVVCSISLFLGGYIYSRSDRDLLNMNTITTFEATSDGVMLITENGDGYYIEK